MDWFPARLAAGSSALCGVRGVVTTPRRRTLVCWDCEASAGGGVVAVVAGVVAGDEGVVVVCGVVAGVGVEV